MWYGENACLCIGPVVVEMKTDLQLKASVNRFVNGVEKLNVSLLLIVIVNLLLSWSFLIWINNYLITSVLLFTYFSDGYLNSQGNHTKIIQYYNSVWVVNDVNIKYLILKQYVMNNNERYRISRLVCRIVLGYFSLSYSHLFCVFVLMKSL